MFQKEEPGVGGGVRKRTQELKRREGGARRKKQEKEPGGGGAGKRNQEEAPGRGDKQPKGRAMRSKEEEPEN